jgi:chromosome segregation ATPase
MHMTTSTDTDIAAWTADIARRRQETVRRIREIEAAWPDVRRAAVRDRAARARLNDLNAEHEGLGEELRRLDQEDTDVAAAAKQQREAAQTADFRARAEAVRAAVLRAEAVRDEFERRAIDDGVLGHLDARLANDMLSALAEAQRQGLGGVNGSSITDWPGFGRSTLRDFCEAWVGHLCHVVPVRPDPSTVRVIPGAADQLNHLNRYLR